MGWLYTYAGGVFFLLGPGLATLLSPPFVLPKVRAERERVWIFFAGGEGTNSDSGRYVPFGLAGGGALH